MLIRRPSLFHRTFFSCLILLAVSSMFRPPAASAANGLPGTTEFGYGARIDLWGQNVSLAVNAAAGIGLDWIGIDFDWNRHWPVQANPVQLKVLDDVMALAQQNGLQVMLSVTHPPAWAVSTNGPDPVLSAGIVSLLASRYPGSLRAVELFPSANTFQGWGKQPDPLAYLALLQHIQAALRESGSPLSIVAGGLTPLGVEHSDGDIDDLVYLDRLYQAGAAPLMPIVSIRLTEITSDPMAAPGAGKAEVLRHYEEVRTIMLNHQHRDGLIWITDFSWPSTTGPTGSDSARWSEPAEQTYWLIEALFQMKSQLYLGAAMFGRLNPPAKGATTDNSPSLIGADLSLHPAFAPFSQVITADRNGYATPLQNILSKKATTDDNKETLKGNGP